MEMIKAELLGCSQSGNAAGSLEKMSFSIEKGALAVFLGNSDSGKSLLAMHLNALISPQSGSLLVNGLNCAAAENVWEIRKCCGLVQEDFDSSFISTYAAEELAFGPRNFGVSEDEIPGKIASALKLTDMVGYENSCPQLLSAAKRQRLAIAAVLAADPDILVLDNPFAALEGKEAEEFVGMIREINAAGKTVVLMTDDPERACIADILFLLERGRIIAQGDPREILSDKYLMENAGLRLPFTAKIYNELLEAGVKLEKCPLTMEELVEEVCR